ncbi:hypothetical protein Dimus_011730, partial [Dionaea muscipula]
YMAMRTVLAASMPNPPSHRGASSLPMCMRPTARGGDARSQGLLPVSRSGKD